MNSDKKKAATNNNNLTQGKKRTEREREGKGTGKFILLISDR